MCYFFPLFLFMHHEHIKTAEQLLCQSVINTGDRLITITDTVLDLWIVIENWERQTS